MDWADSCNPLGLFARLPEMAQGQVRALEFADPAFFLGLLATKRG
jgi:hypothetical protein